MPEPGRHLGPARPPRERTRLLLNARILVAFHAFHRHFHDYPCNFRAVGGMEVMEVMEVVFLT